MNIYLTQLGEFVLGQSWQIALLVLIVAFITFFLKNISAHVRYLLWLVVLAKCLIPPLYGVPLHVLPPATVNSELFGIRLSEMPNAPESGDTVDSALASSRGLSPELPPVEPEPPATRQTKVFDVQMLTWARICHGLGLAWLAGMCSCLAFNILRALRTHNWLRRVRRPLPLAFQQDLPGFFSSHGFARLPKIWVADDVSQPFVWGLVRGSIYLPLDFLHINDPAQQYNTLAHELSHIVRFDAAVNSLQVIAQCLFWFHPFVWWANIRIRREREKCCDEMAVAGLGARPQEYGMAVLETLIVPRESARRVPSLAIAGPARNLEERIRAMMTPGKKFHKHPSLVAAIVIALMALLIVPTALVLTARAQTDTVSETVAEPVQQPPTSLVEAAENGDLAAIQNLIAKGVNVNASEGDGIWTPLAAAAYRGHSEIVKVLLANGAEVDKADGYYTPLYYAIWSDDNASVKALIAADTDVNILPDERDYPPVVYAIWQAHVDNVKTLLDAGATLDHKDEKGCTPLYWAAFYSSTEVFDLILARGDYEDTVYLAASRGQLEKVKAFIKDGADVNAKDAFGCTVLHWAVLANSPEVAEFLIAEGVDLNAKDNTESAPITVANGLTMIKLLISKGADVDTKATRHKRTRLQMACSTGEKGIVEFLIGQGADIQATDDRGREPLHQAAAGGHVDIAELLIAKGADLNVRAGNSATPLWEAASYGKADMVKFLLAKGADISVADRRGQTPLQVAKRRGHAEVVNILRQHGATETLHGAAASGDVDTVKRWLSRGADVNAQSETGETPLHLAAAQGRKAVVEILIEKGADVNARSRNGRTPLWLAALAGHMDLVRFLVAKGADVNIADNRGRMPVDIARQRGRNEVVDILSQHGAKETLHGAVASGNIDEVKRLISEGADINAKNEDGRTPLHLAANRGPGDLIEFLVSHGADRNVKDVRGQIPLHEASKSGNVDAARLLIGNDATINTQSEEWESTPLHCAASKGHREVVELLVANGAHLEDRNFHGQTPLHLAAYRDRRAVVNTLLANGADIEARTKYDRTPLAMAIAIDNSHIEMAELLLDKGANIHARIEGAPLIDVVMRNNDPQTVAFLMKRGAPLPPVHEAAFMGHLDTVKEQLGKGVPVDLRDTGGFTPLHCAVFGRHKDVILFLVDSGADVNARATNGRFPLAYADKEIAELLIAKGASVRLKDTFGQTLLHWAANRNNYQGDIEQMKLFLSHGADVNARAYSNAVEWEGWTPFHVACRNGNKSIAEMLIAAGADIHAKTDKGYTPLSLAKEKERTEVVQLLLKHGAKE